MFPKLLSILPLLKHIGIPNLHREQNNIIKAVYI